MKSPLIVVFTLFFLLFVGANVYVLHRLWQLVPASAPALRIAVLVCGILLSLAFIAGMAARSSTIPVGIVSFSYRAGSAWVFVFLYLTIIFLIGDLLRVTHVIPDKVMVGNWLTLGILSGVLVAIFVFGNVVYHNKRRVEINLDADIARPMKIVAASDLHLGFGIGRRELARWVDMINREKPDAVIFAGDIIDTSTRPLWQGDFAAELRRIDAPYGVYTTLGNHEYISGAEESIRFLEHADIKVLRDSIALVSDGVCIVGRDDASNPLRKSIAALTENLFDDQTTILLDHQPYRLEEAAQAGIDLQISRHTHRGQVIPITWITVAMFERSHGSLQKGGTKYYISTGLGIWGGKFRIGSRSEYIVVNLTPTKNRS